MPELPEVETAVRELAPLLAGREVTSADLRWARTLAFPDSEAFARDLVGSSFERFGRRGKYILLGLRSATPVEGSAAAVAAVAPTLVVHLRMTGRLSVESADHPVDAHTHLILSLDDGSALHFRDPRKFGRVWLTQDTDALLSHLGPEADDPTLTPDLVAVRLVGRRAPIKALLLDQSIWAGVGNIYADEALYAAHIDPRRPAGTLSLDEVATLQEAVRALLTAAIARKGSSLGLASTNYQRPGGEAGGYQEAHQVFRRTGEPCPTCGAPIERVIIAQRSTHFCPQCQR